MDKQTPKSRQTAFKVLSYFWGFNYGEKQKSFEINLIKIKFTIAKLTVLPRTYKKEW
ncbi:hypothetical protein [Desulfosporosinus fructosivorans]|uniref:hypothetical protein n=1 Tax=Desulfosporosinus fructosivorans TaxID=2018669 RepID=UPI00130E4086|nr:hypothetical protein [Desulfosporosinus fructosivorans]